MSTMTTQELIQQLENLKKEKDEKGSYYKPFSWWNDESLIKRNRKSVYSWGDKRFFETAHDFSRCIALLSGLIEDSLAAAYTLDRQRILSDNDIFIALFASIRMAEYICNETSRRFDYKEENEEAQN